MPPLIVGLVKVLLVHVSELSGVAKLSLCSAAFHSDREPVILLPVPPKSNDLFVDYLYAKSYDLEEDEYIVVNFTPYTTKAGKQMSHIVLSDKNKVLTRAIAFPAMYKMTLAKMREGMKCKVTLAKLDDGTLNIKEIK